MSNFNEQGIVLLSTTTVSHAAATQTTLYTVPAGKRCILDHVKIIAAGDEAATDITIGQSGALTDFVNTRQLDNLDAQYDCVKVGSGPSTDPATKIKSYAAATIIQVDVIAANGNAGNTYKLFGTLY